MLSGYQYTPWIWPLLASAAFTGAVGLYLWRRRDTPGARALALAAFVMALWCLTNAAEVAALDFETQRTWFFVRDALALPGVIAALWFALEYAGFSRLLTRPVVAILVGSVIAHLPFYLIEDARLYWSRIWWDQGIKAELAPLGALFSIYGFALFLVVTAIFLILFVRSPAHRVPVALILIGQLSVRVAYPLGALNIAHLPHVPLIILAFDFATLMYVVALFRFRMFDLVPVARETIIDLMPDAMLVVDSRGRIADLNAAAARLFEVSRPKALGRLVTEVLQRFPGIAERSLSEPASSDDIELAPDAGRRWTQVSTRKLTDWQGAQIGRLVLLHDVTELRHAEERLLEHERALAVSQVREQMARDLHDSVSQVLGYVSMQADATYKLLSDARHDEAGRQLQRLAGVAREAHADVRGYIQELHEASSEQRPLADALRRETERFTRNYGIDVRLTVEPRPDGFALAPERQTRLLRMVQEALTNARRHGLAPHIRIDVRAHDSVGEIVIEDDGLGFDPAALTAAPGDRYGLRFMRERAFELDAELDIDSAPGRGTRVGIRVPLRVDMEDGPVRDRSAMVGQRVERR